MSISSWWLLCNSRWLRWGNFCFRALDNGKVVILLRVCLFGFLCLIIKHSFDSLHFFPSLILYIPKELCLLHSGQDRLCFLWCACVHAPVWHMHIWRLEQRCEHPCLCAETRETLWASFLVVSSLIVLRQGFSLNLARYPGEYAWPCSTVYVGVRGSKSGPQDYATSVLISHWDISQLQGCLIYKFILEKTL